MKPAQEFVEAFDWSGKAALLNLVEAVQNDALPHLSLLPADHIFEVDHGTHRATCLKCGYQQYGALPKPVGACPKSHT